jgi:hypothetical protein
MRDVLYLYCYVSDERIAEATAVRAKLQRFLALSSKNTGTLITTQYIANHSDTSSSSSSTHDDSTSSNEQHDTRYWSESEHTLHATLQQCSYEVCMLLYTNLKLTPLNTLLW